MNNIFEKFKLMLPEGLELSEVTTNLQDGTSSHIVFYRLGENEQSQDLFLKRLNGVTPGLLVLNKKPKEDIEVPYVVLDFKKFLPFQIELCDFLYNKSNEVKIIGVTGTNGKSTVVHLCHEILKGNGFKSFTIGTIGVCDGDKELLPSPGATTPSYVDLRRILHKLSDYDFACLEVSSHALDQDRLNGIELVCAGWTNLTQDHLDYHGTMEEYFRAKLLIKENSKHNIVVPFGEESLVSMLEEKSAPYKVSASLKVDDLNDSFSLEYNKKNLSLANELVDIATSKKCVIPNSIELPKGRYNSFRYNKSLFVVDYAHTPDAIKNVVLESKKAFPKANIITVFGCGGDRDRLKRPLMLEAALLESSEVVVTTDNPRSEDPEQIISDALKGNENNPKVKAITNRKEAIHQYVKDYDNETVVIIAGKGHEEYQEVNGVKNYFSDIAEVQAALKEL
jgi:UDP-N-acetylmuramoyl-L-alanyl-D-glutamate--2,6-diaminopimelate ligase